MVEGIVDGASELIGSSSVSGFEALAALDSNGDGVINASDAAYATLGLHGNTITASSSFTITDPAKGVTTLMVANGNEIQCLQRVA
jgi:hypothetical protein